MNILVTGAKGFVGRNLVENLKNIRDGKDKTKNFVVSDIYEYDIDSTIEELDIFCSKADFVFNLAGVNRPKDNSEFMAGNFGFASTLLETLKKYNNKAKLNKDELKELLTAYILLSEESKTIKDYDKKNVIINIIFVQNKVCL